MKKVLLPLACLSLTTALADRVPENLTGFKSVCVNGNYAEKGKDVDSVTARLLGRLRDGLKKAGIPIATTPCQPKGLTANRQLNLYFDFFTTEHAKAYQSSLDGWLNKEGPYSKVSIWNTYFAGNPGDNDLVQEATDLLDTMLKEFLTDWKATH